MMATEHCDKCGRFMERCEDLGDGAEVWRCEPCNWWVMYVKNTDLVAQGGC